MNLYLRLLWALLSSHAKDRLHHLGVTESGFRVLPHDLDAFGHMNNGRYLQIMDVARTEWMVRTGVLANIRRQRWAPVLGGGFVRFRHSLHLMQRYSVRTRLLGWDPRWFFLEHVFFDDRRRSVAKGVTRAALRGSGAWVHTREVANLIEPGAASPELPGFVLDWLELEDQMYRFEHVSALQAEIEVGRFTS